MARVDLPLGTVTFLFSDVEGSTKLLHALGPEAYADALAEHRRLLRDAFARHGGAEVDTQGDAFFVAFPTAPGALAAATGATAALGEGPIRVRIGLHTGTPLVTEEGYVGADVHRAARIAAAGHGGQILVSAATAALLGPEAALRDLGIHRLKDLSGPERIYQADADDHPPLRTLHRTNLPVPATPFLGREQELAELTALNADDDVRLVTLTGPGGTGKTRLALQAAAEAADRFADGVWWVPLASLRDPALVLSTAAAALGATGDLAEYIGEKALLLVLDNFEHLTDAAADLSTLLAACPKVTLLVTSRQPLHLAGEHEFAVDPLSPGEAVELFLTRAVAVRRDFTGNGEVARICARLDYLPLAIELAAARVKLLPAPALLARLEQRLPLLAGGARDLPERQRTLRATIEWSHDLLAAEEQRLFAALAVFRGGSTLAAAESVADADLDTLQSLVDKSLVRVRPDGRFWMLETIREFAVERLEASGEADARRDRHAAFFLAFAEEAEPHVMRDDPEWVERIAPEHDNLRSALDRFELRADTDAFARLCGALWRFWYLRSHLAEGQRRLEAALASDSPAPVRAKLLVGASVMAFNLGRLEQGLEYAQQALEIEHRLGNEWGVAYATLMIANCLSELRDFAGGRDRLEDARQRFEALGDRHYALIAHHNQGWLVGELGDPEEAHRIYLESLDTAREIGHAAIEADAIAQIGMIARDDGRLDEALDLLRQAISIHHERASPLDLATNVGRLASVCCRRGQPETAARLVGASESLHAQLGGQQPWWAIERNEATIDRVCAVIGPEATERELAAGRALSPVDVMELVTAVG